MTISDIKTIIIPAIISFALLAIGFSGGCGGGDAEPLSPVGAYGVAITWGNGNCPGIAAGDIQADRIDIVKLSDGTYRAMTGGVELVGQVGCDSEMCALTLQGAFSDEDGTGRLSWDILLNSAGEMSGGATLEFSAPIVCTHFGSVTGALL